MADIIQVNEAFRCQLLAREAESAAALLLAYGTVWTALADRRDAVLAVIERAQARGETVAPSLVIASCETRQLLLQVAGEIDSLAPALTDHVTTEQAAAVALAQQALPNLIAAAMGPAPVNVSVGPVRHLPAEAFTDLVGFLSDGSPLRRLFDGFGADAS
jgi:sugar/nucleoside kinase (ribokinase family)